MFPRRVILGAALFALMLSSGCSKEEASVRLECPDFEPLPAHRLSIEGARKAFEWAEMRRELRYREAIDPGYFMRVTKPIVEQGKIDRGLVCYEDLYKVGRLIFEHEFNFADGLGRDDAATREDPFRRVQDGLIGGPETNTCSSCHWRGGPAGAGAVQDNSFLFGDGANTNTADQRNPPALQGAGVAQLVAQEMSSELQAQMALAMIDARSEGEAKRIHLEAKGISFGHLTLLPNGMVDSSELHGVDEDLVIKPFGWRGDAATLRDFVEHSAQVHLGIQSEDLILHNGHKRPPDPIGKGPVWDPDKDGVVQELSAGQLTSLIVYLASLELPVVHTPTVLREFEAPAEGIGAPVAHDFYERFTEGERLFDEIGCAQCHVPMVVLKNPVFRTRSRYSGELYEIDLSRQGEEPRLSYNEQLGGYPVWLFSDMKRHDLGEENAGQHPGPGYGASEYLTRRLWGLAKSGPYFYDGRAPNFDAAIMAHGGEGEFARDGWSELDRGEQASLRLYLFSLQRAARPVIP